MLNKKSEKSDQGRLLLEEFNLLGLDVEDILSLLQAALEYRQIQIDYDLNKWEFSIDQDEEVSPVCGLFNSKRTKIKTIELNYPGHNFFHRINFLIQSLKNPIVTKVSRVMFSNKLLTGYVEVKDHFRIYPIHEWVSIVDSGIVPSQMIIGGHDHNIDKFGPPFPIIIEVEVDVSIEHPLFIKRRNTKLDCYQYIVSLCIRGISPITFLSQDRIWTGHFNLEKTEFAYRLANFGMNTEDEPSFDRYVSEGGKESVWYDEEVDYLDALLLGQKLMIPKNVFQFFKEFEQLDVEKKQNFIRAAFLFSQAEFLKNHNAESAVTYVSAIECLFENEEVIRCETCNVEKLSLSVKFKKFMETFAPTSEHTINKRKKMYDTRSKSAHGIHVSRIDGEAGQIFGVRMNEYLFSCLTRKALFNWLMSKK